MSAKFILLSLCASLTAADEPSYKLLEHYMFEWPITKKEFENWNTHKSAVMTKNNGIIVPEVQDAKGAMNHKWFTETAMDSWILDVKLRIGNEDKTSKGG